MSAPDVTVVIPVSRRAQHLDKILALVGDGFQGTGKSYEILMIVDGELPERLEEARAVARTHDNLRVLRFARRFGEGAALRAGLMAGMAPIILTHPAYYQVPADVIPKLLAAVDDGAELAFASRLPQSDSVFNRVQRWAFNAILRILLGVRSRDFACGVRVLRREALEEIALHAGFHRFISVTAVMAGLDVKEVDSGVHPQARRSRPYSPGTYVKRLLDIANVFFLTKFLDKPLRFFGFVGGALFTAGFLLCAWLSVERLFGSGDKALADRPLFLLAVLMLAFGFQTLALGLLGEIISFSHSSRSKPYRIREVVRRQPDGEPKKEPIRAD